MNYLILNSFSQIDRTKLMELYHEGNVENVAYIQPPCNDIAKGIKIIEDGFMDFLKNEFYHLSEAKYYILEENDKYLSGLRLNKIDDFYLMEALETAPQYRKQGFACKLINDVKKSFENKGEFVIRSNVSKKNIASINTHKKCGFIIEKDYGVNYFDNEKRENCYTMMYSYPQK